MLIGSPPLLAAFEGHSVAFALVLDENGFAHHLLASVPPGFRPVDERPSSLRYRLSHAPDGVWALFEDDVCVASHDSLTATRAYFAGLLMQRAATAGVAHCYLHAGVVADRGSAIILPGRSGVGKSTLTAALVAAGATYLSDEYALIDDSGEIHPFPRAIAYEDMNGRRHIIEPAPTGVARSGPHPPGLVVLTRFAPSATPNIVRTLDKAQAVGALLEHTLSLSRAPERTLGRLTALVARCQVVEVPRGEAEEFGAWLLRHWRRLTQFQTGSDGERPDL